MLEEKVRRKRVGIGQHDEHALRRACRDFLEAVEDTVLLFLRIREGEGTHGDAGERCGPSRDRRSILNFAGSADDASRDASKERATAETRVRALDDRLELVFKLWCDKQKSEVGNRSVKRGEGGPERVLGRCKAG